MKNINSEVVPELIQLIFSKLPFVNLSSCRLVCKAWNNLISTCKFHPPFSTSNIFFVQKYSCDSNFFHCLEFNPKHLEGMSSVAKFRLLPDLPFATISIVNSCNGLLCCFFGHGPTKTRPYEVEVFILNPMTNEYFKPPLSDKADYIRYCYYGFGFSPKTKEYKLARLSFALHKRATLVEIFTFGTSRKWTPIGSLPSYMRMEDNGVYFNGGLYWVGTHRPSPPYKSVIYRLDIEDEKLHKIYLPQLHDGASLIGVFNDTLCLTISTLDRLEYQVWKMEEDFSWTKAFDVKSNLFLSYQPFHLQPIRAFEDDKILCLLDRHSFILYNSKMERMELLTEKEYVKKILRIDSFNFDSLHEILGVDA